MDQDSDRHLQRIYAVASSFRAALESVDDASLPIGLWEFPELCCDDACLYLATALKAQGCGDFVRFAADIMPPDITDSDGFHPSGHVWLEQDDIIVDITGDEFRPALPPVFVARGSEWHAALRLCVFRYTGDIFTLEPSATDEELKTYDLLMKIAFDVR